MTKKLPNEPDWNSVLTEFTDLYLDQRGVKREKEELENYPQHLEQEIDEDEFGKHYRKIRDEIDELAEK